MNTDQTRRDFMLSWTLDAPRAQVYRAWTGPDYLGWYYNDHQPIQDEVEVHEWLSLGIQNGWRATVDRLAATFASASVTV